MYDHHELLNLVEVLKHLKGYMVVPVNGEELVILRKDEFDELKAEKKEVQLELGETEVEPEISQHELDLINHELEMEHVDYDMGVDSDKDEQLGAGPRKKVRFEPLRGDLSPELQE